MNRAAIYCRISQDPEGRELGVQRQEEDCRALSDRLGFDPDMVDVYVDNDVSASTRGTKRRPQFERMMERAEAGDYAALIAYSNSRLTRRPIEFDRIIGLAERRGVQVSTVASGRADLSNADGRAVARTIAAWDAAEAERTSERAQRAKLQAAQAGRWRGGPRPFGYESDGVTIRPAEADALREVMRGVVNGRSMRSLAAELTERGFTGTRGQQLVPQHLRRLILRPRNAGLVEHKGEILNVPAEWPAIVPESLWRAACAVLTDPRRVTNKVGSRTRWLGAGLYRCGVCDAAMESTRTNGGKPSYRCSEGGHVSRAGGPLDEYVLTFVARLLDSDTVRAQMRAASDQVGVVNRASDQTRELRARLAGFEADYHAGLINGRQLQEATHSVTEQIERLDAEVRRAASDGVLENVIGSDDPGAALLAAPLDVQRAILRATVRVTVDLARKGRPPGWVPGTPYFDLETIRIEPVELGE